MKQITQLQCRPINMGSLLRFSQAVFIMVVLLYASPLACQNAIESIRELKQGTLILRFPAFKPKIDTLQSMISRSDSEVNKKRLQLLLDEAIEERESIQNDYTAAFREFYNFSKVAWLNDFESRSLSSAHYYQLDKTPVEYNELKKGPVFYLIFDRTEESKLGGLIITDHELKPVERPFPNNFSTGGLGVLLNKFSNITLAASHAKKINKKLHKFYGSVN